MQCWCILSHWTAETRLVTHTQRKGRNQTRTRGTTGGPAHQDLAGKETVHRYIVPSRTVPKLNWTLREASARHETIFAHNNAGSAQLNNLLKIVKIKDKLCRGGAEQLQIRNEKNRWLDKYIENKTNRYKNEGRKSNVQNIKKVSSIKTTRCLFQQSAPWCLY